LAHHYTCIPTILTHHYTGIPTRWAYPPMMEGHVTQLFWSRKYSYLGYFYPLLCSKIYIVRFLSGQYCQPDPLGQHLDQALNPESLRHICFVRSLSASRCRARLVRPAPGSDFHRSGCESLDSPVSCHRRKTAVSR
jgi:hypothetical protein